MKVLNHLLLLSFFSFFSNLALSLPNISLPDHIVYGEDNRLDIYENENFIMQGYARSVVVMMRQYYVIDVPGDPSHKELSAQTLGAKKNLCEDQKFRDQPAPGDCTGFLVAKDIIATAGHCMKRYGACEDTNFIFDFSLKHEDENPAIVKTKDIYTCKEIIATSEDPQATADYALVRLDRSVPDRIPLRLRSEGKIELDEEVTIIGHPSGIPLKIAEEGYVRANDDPTFFMTNSDAFGGNSGSPVINNSTGEVEGILTNGGKDYVTTDAGCQAVHKCLLDECRGEDVTRTSYFIKKLPTPEQKQPSKSRL